MTNNVTDTNVGKMTEEEAVNLLSLELRCTGTQCESCSYTTLCVSGNHYNELDKALTMAIKALQFIESLKKELELMQEEHPYKFFGNPESYSPYNEGWCDATDRIESMVNRRDEE